MNKINKILLNQPITLSENEVENVKETLKDVIPSAFPDLSSYLTKVEAAETYQPLGDYATTAALYTASSTLNDGTVNLSGATATLNTNLNSLQTTVENSGLFKTTYGKNGTIISGNLTITAVSPSDNLIVNVSGKTIDGTLSSYNIGLILPSGQNTPVLRHAAMTSGGKVFWDQTQFQPSGEYYSASNPSGFLTELPESATNAIENLSNTSGNWNDTFNTVCAESASWGNAEGKVDQPTPEQTGKLVYDGSSSAWVSLPTGVTTIVQGENGVSSRYDNENSIYYLGQTDEFKASYYPFSEPLHNILGKISICPDAYHKRIDVIISGTNPLGEASAITAGLLVPAPSGTFTADHFLAVRSGQPDVEWVEITGGGGGATYSAGEGIGITDDIISFTGIDVDTSYSSTLPKPEGNGTSENPLSMSAFSDSVETIFNSFSNALSNLANQVEALGSTITLKGEGTANDINNWMQNAQIGDAYITTTDGSIWGKTVSKGDMIVKLESTVSVLSTAPNLSEYAKHAELPTVVAGANIIVTPTLVDGHKQYMITSIGGGGGGGGGISYQFNSDDSRFSWTPSADNPDDPTIITETLNVNLPKFEAVTSIPGTIQPNTYYFIYE